MLEPAQVRFLISDYYHLWQYWTRQQRLWHIAEVHAYYLGQADAYCTMYWSLLLMLQTTDYYTHGNGD